MDVSSWLELGLAPGRHGDTDQVLASRCRPATGAADVMGLEPTWHHMSPTAQGHLDPLGDTSDDATPFAERQNDPALTTLVKPGVDLPFSLTSMATVHKAHLLQWSPNTALFPRHCTLSLPPTSTPISETSASLSLSAPIPKYTTSKKPTSARYGGCYPSICQVEAEGSGIQGQPRLH